nr:hypothetical protein [Psychrobacter sp. PraFG1]UNK05517.1 hypothetical protein MN210_00910 [Psychrobacter sp. PraFG1]
MPKPITSCKNASKNADDPEAQARLLKKLKEMDLAQLASVSGMSLERLQQSVAIDKSVDATNEEAVKAAMPKGQAHIIYLY